MDRTGLHAFWRLCRFSRRRAACISHTTPIRETTRLHPRPTLEPHYNDERRTTCSRSGDLISMSMMARSANTSPRYFLCYRDPLEHDHNALPQDLGHAGLTARIQRFLQPLRSLQDQFTEVHVESTTANRYHITAVGRLDRTYFDGQQPKECLDKTRFIQDVDLVLDVEEDPTQGWVVVSNDDSTRPNTSECRNPA